MLSFVLSKRYWAQQNACATLVPGMLFLIALHIAPFELVMPIFFSVLVQYLTFLTVVKQMHVVVVLGTVFP